MVDFLTEPLSQEFIRRAMVEVVLIALASGALGCWVVFYGVSYAAESLAHAIFPGLVIAALAGVPILIGGGPGIVVAALAIALVGRVPGISRDTAVAVVVTGFFGLGALLALSPDSPPGIQSLLFGDILAPSNADLILAGILAAAVVLALLVLHWRLLAVAFDRTTAGSMGASPTLADIAVLVLLAAAVLVAVQGLGSLLAVAALVGPAATARVFTHRVTSMMLASSLIGIGAGVAGLFLSYYAGVAAGAAIAGCIVVAYLVAIIVSGLRSLRYRPSPSSRLGGEVA
jgi:ABC-type Mn2+/Zn2+ transport system permease subunit